MSKIAPFFWFNNQAEEAIKFYTSIFKGSKVGAITRYGKAGPLPEGTFMTGSFELAGQEFIALNGGPEYTFTPAISFFVHCDTQAEVDELWDKLTEGGEIQQCGWLTDKFGVT
jgi:predicted 3-demethylubiquinone-9 3-methyltransferase (glyoxalase superfamily)